MIRVADYIAQSLASHGITDVFLVTGGGAMHLNDAIGRCRELRPICCHHEQACAMAAESYFRLTGRLAAVNVTTGPGATNAITGVHGAWTDSMGMVVISGQVKRETLVRTSGLPLRQLGDQEVDIVPMVAPITKYAAMVTDPASIRMHLEKAIHAARSGRPGPVWLDVPMDIQGAQVDPETLAGFTPEPEPDLAEEDLDRAAGEVLARLARAERPAILAGSGIRTGAAGDLFLVLAERLGIPVTTAFNAHDLVPHGHPLLCGRPGTIGDRAGNFTVQNSDFLLVLACRLNIRQISYNWGSFARNAYQVMVDIDPAELRKPTLRIDLPIAADVGRFLRRLMDLAPRRTHPGAPALPGLVPGAGAPLPGRAAGILGQALSHQPVLFRRGPVPRSRSQGMSSSPATPPPASCRSRRPGSSPASGSTPTPAAPPWAGTCPPRWAPRPGPRGGGSSVCPGTAACR